MKDLNFSKRRGYGDIREPIISVCINDGDAKGIPVTCRTFSDGYAMVVATYVKIEEAK